MACFYVERKTHLQDAFQEPESADLYHVVIISWDFVDVKIPSSRSSPWIVLPTLVALGPREEFSYSLLSSTACCFGLSGIDWRERRCCLLI